MGAIFTSPGRTVVAGIVLLILIIVAVTVTKAGAIQFGHEWEPSSCAGFTS